MFKEVELMGWIKNTWIQTENINDWGIFSSFDNIGIGLNTNISFFLSIVFNNPFWKMDKEKESRLAKGSNFKIPPLLDLAAKTIMKKGVQWQSYFIPHELNSE